MFLFQSESDAASTSLLVAAFNGRADKVNPAKTTIGPILSKFFSFLAASFGAEVYWYRGLLVQRCNGTTAGLGYLEVNVMSPLDG